MDSDMVIRFFTEYGWIMTALATSGILFIGVLKSFGLFDKLNKKIKKYVYFGLSCIISIVACTAYLCATDAFEWKGWSITIACIIPYTLAIYGLYENTGLRGLLQKVLFAPVKKLAGRLWQLLVSGKIGKDSVKDALEDFVEDVVSDIADAVTEEEKEHESITDDVQNIDDPTNSSTECGNIDVDEQDNLNKDQNDGNV